jgi:hypothetical protein
MRITRRTGDDLVIEEGAGANRMIGLCFLALGVGGMSVGWVKGHVGFFMIAAIFLLFGLRLLLFTPTKTHHFERSRGLVTIESRGRLGGSRRELPFDSIEDIVLEEIRKAGSAPSYYVYYVTRQGERLRWADSYDGSKENTTDCFNAGRELVMAGVRAPGASAVRQPGLRR